MIRISTALALAFAMVPALAGAQAPAPSAAGAPATAAEARMLIERAKQEIAQEEKSWSEEIAREKEADARRKQRFAEFNQDRQRLQQALAEQEEKLKATLAKIESHQFRSRELAARFKRLSETLAAKAKELRPAVAAGLPYRLDKRLENLDLLLRDLEGGNISTEEAFNRLWTFEQAERRMAQEAENYTGDFTGDGGDPMQVKYLRIGKQILAFSSMDGSRLGMLRPTADSAGKGWTWVREDAMDRDTRKALKHAIATAEGKSVPGFVPMPLWKEAFASAEPAAAAKGASK